MPAAPATVSLALVHSPLTGGSFWHAVHDALWANGRRASLARLPAAEHIHPPYWLTHAAGVAANLPGTEPVVLVGHSGAGPILPAIGRLARNRSGAADSIAGYLFVDCDLPRDGCCRFDLFDDPSAADALRTRCRGGWLPRWRDDELRGVLPDAGLRAAFLAELPRTPRALYEELISVPDDWPEAPCGYLALSPGYPGAVARATKLGWPLRRLETHHFSPLTHADLVAGALGALLDDVLAAPDHGRHHGPGQSEAH